MPTPQEKGGDVHRACDSVTPKGQISPYHGMAVTCDVQHGTVQEDFAAMLAADILLITSSSLSTWASYVGRVEQTVYYMPYIPYMGHSVRRILPTKECVDLFAGLLKTLILSMFFSLSRRASKTTRGQVRRGRAVRPALYTPSLLSRLSGARGAVLHAVQQAAPLQVP